jgi:murein DD-endopeptidase MepM/ murein hydrolase activator NlpD
MANPYRFLALGVLGTFGVVSTLAVSGVEPRERKPARPLVKEAQARPAAPAPTPPPPVEVARADTLRKGETLSELLERTRLGADDARSLRAEIEAAHDVRTFRPGLVLRYTQKTATGELVNAELALDADHVLSVERGADGLEAAVEEVEVRADTAVLAGTVSSSLYQALLEGDGSVPRAERERLADILADQIFAWKVDFSRDLQPGNAFRIVYERMARPDGTARSGRVLAVQFEIGDRLQEAYLFRQNDRDDYFDADGESLRRAFLRAPLEFRRISSTFSTGRYHPILHRIRAHKGVDYAASTGTPVRAVGDGVVASAGRDRGYGNVVHLRHMRGYASRYAHLSRFAEGVRAGVRVHQGDVIGYVGSTGLSTGPHLHYEFHSDGRAVNPSTIKFITGDPIAGGSRSRFRSLVEQRMAAMDRAGTPRLAARPTSERPPLRPLPRHRPAPGPLRAAPEGRGRERDGVQRRSRRHGAQLRGGGGELGARGGSGRRVRRRLQPRADPRDRRLRPAACADRRRAAQRG